MSEHPLRRIILTIIRPLMKIIFPYRLVGLENLPAQKEGERLIICCNHISIVDPVYLLLGCKRPIYFMAKSELFQNWFTRWILGTVMGAFPVNRGTGDMSAINHAFDLIKGGNIFGIFPQGTCRRQRELGLPKSGAALIACRTGATVIPAALITKEFHVRAFRKVTLAFGQPITPEEMQLVDEEHPKLRHASRLIMERIDQLIEENLPENER
jgi:1-acyl-sn-glycerol-3-phosphate acyltransferase